MPYLRELLDNLKHLITLQMDNSVGWVSIYRQIQDHWIWKDPVKLKWWLDILFTVNNTDAKINIGFQIYDCKRGESIMSLQSWADRWGTSKDSTRNFLKLLEKDNMIKCVSIVKSTRITVCNYDYYQGGLHVKQTQSKRNPNAIQTLPHANNNDNNDNNDNNIYSVFGFFDEKFSLVWQEFKKHRVKIKKPLTEHAEVINLNEVLKICGSDSDYAKKVVNKTISKGWQGFFPIDGEAPKSLEPQKEHSKW